jgi:hypothetical protein
MPTILPGPTAVKGYAAIIVETVGVEGTYVPPSAQVPVSDATPHLAGGSMGLEPVAGQRWANQAALSAELVASCDFNGPFTNANALILAAMAGAAGELPAYSAEINPGLGTSIRLAGGCMDKFSLKGAVGSAVTYSATMKAQSLATGTAGTPTAAVVTPFSLAGIAITGGLALAAQATAFQIDIDNAVKTQVVFGSRTSAYVFSTAHAVTGKVTTVMTATTDLAAYITSTPFSVVVALSNATGTKTYTMASCQATDLSAPLKVGSITVQDISFIAFVSGGGSTAALVLS